MIKQLGFLLVASLATCSAAIAQPMGDADSQRDRAEKPAVANPSDTAKSPVAPVPGKNSFTEGEAKKRLEKNGYAGVQGLAKDESSIWHAQAVKGGKAVNVTLDYQGNITEK